MKTKNFPIFFVLLFSFFFILPQNSSAEKKILAADLVKDGQKIDLSQEKYTLLFQDLKRDNSFTQSELDTLFRDVRIKRKVLVLMDTQWEAKPYYEYRPRFITRSVIKKAKKKLRKHRVILDRIERELGVNREVIIAIWGIESRFGKHSGGFNVFRTLNTLFDAYPRRSDFFRKQLIAFLALCKENKYDPLSIKGSYAGAFGQTQFIPSSFREYAVSFDGDNRRDVFGSTHDILASIANYLRRFHWTLNAPLYVDIGLKLNGPEVIRANSAGRKGLVNRLTVQKEQSIALPVPPENRPLTIVGLELSPKKGGGKRYVAGYPNFQAITEWNHSNRYAMAVSELAEAIK
jgi:membrane-bound lytic murein transglycosylase B